MEFLARRDQTGHEVIGVPVRWERRGNEFLACLLLIVSFDEYALAVATLPVQLSPWPAQTPTEPLSSTPKRSLKRRRSRDDENASTSKSAKRQVVVDSAQVEQAMTDCQLLSDNSVISCFPTSDTVVAQHQWISFVWNSRRPEITQANLVDIFLFHGDSRQQILHYPQVKNPSDQAGRINAQVNDTWLGNRATNFQGQNISYPYYWVLIPSGTTIDSNAIAQPTFTAVQTTYADFVIASSSSAAAASSASAASAASASLASASAASESSVSASRSSVSAASNPSNSSTLQQGSSGKEFPHWAIAVIVVLGFFAIAATCLLFFLIMRRIRRRQEYERNRNSMGSASPMMANAGGPSSPLLGGVAAAVAGSVTGHDGVRDGASVHDGASTEAPFSGEDAAIMADAFRKMLRKPDFAARRAEEGESPNSPDEEGKESILGRELAEEGRDIQSVRLPPVALRSIFDLALEDRVYWRRDALSYGLVCKSWSIIFDVVFGRINTLNFSDCANRLDVGALARSLSLRPERGRFLRSISLDMFKGPWDDHLGFADTEDAEYDWLSPTDEDIQLANEKTMGFLEKIFTFAVSIREVHLRDLQTSLTRDAIFALAKLTNVTTASFVTFNPAMRPIVTNGYFTMKSVQYSIATWRQLKTLDIRHWADYDDERQHQRCPLQLEHPAFQIEDLRLEYGRLDGAQLRWFTLTHQAYLKNLQLTDIVGLSNQNLLHFLDAIAPTITILSISHCFIIRYHETEALAVDVVLPKMADLEDLTVQGDLISSKSIVGVNSPLPAGGPIGRNLQVLSSSHLANDIDILEALEKCTWKSVHLEGFPILPAREGLTDKIMEIILRDYPPSCVTQPECSIFRISLTKAVKANFFAYTIEERARMPYFYFYFGKLGGA
ncbi:hypothetical protein H0H93_007748 [Arthromyces matolae]|nr:hypothetical protein H0H93_007748 [Arthromyces matolae]